MIGHIIKYAQPLPDTHYHMLPSNYHIMVSVRSYMVSFGLGVIMISEWSPQPPKGGNSLVVVVALVPPYSHSTVLRALGGAVVCKYCPYSSFLRNR